MPMRGAGCAKGWEGRGGAAAGRHVPDTLSYRPERFLQAAAGYCRLLLLMRIPCTSTASRFRPHGALCWLKMLPARNVSATWPCAVMTCSAGRRQQTAPQQPVARHRPSEQHANNRNTVKLPLGPLQPCPSRGDSSAQPRLHASRGRLLPSTLGRCEALPVRC